MVVTVSVRQGLYELMWFDSDVQAGVVNQSSLDINEDDSIRNRASPSKYYVKILVGAIRVAILLLAFYK